MRSYILISTNDVDGFVNGKSGPLTEGCFYFGNHHKQLANFEEDLQLHFVIFGILGLKNVEKVLH